MTIIELCQYGDFDIEYTDAIMVGECAIPNIPDGTLKEDAIKILKQHGFKFANSFSLTFTDDYFCSSESETERKDRRLRLSK